MTKTQWSKGAEKEKGGGGKKKGGQKLFAYLGAAKEGSEE